MSSFDAEIHGENNTLMVGKENLYVKVTPEENDDPSQSSSPEEFAAQPTIWLSEGSSSRNSGQDWIMATLDNVRGIGKAINRGKILSSVENVYKKDDSCKPFVKEPNNVLCLDCSSKMSNSDFEKMKEIAHAFVNAVEDTVEDHIEQNIAVVCVSEGARVVQQLTIDFASVRDAIDNLPHEGRCTLFEAVVVSLAAADVNASPEADRSRVIFITCGRPCEESTDEQTDLSAISQMTLFRFIKSLVEHPRLSDPHSLTWIPIEGADMEFMRHISKFGGVLQKADDVKELAKFFVKEHS